MRRIFASPVFFGTACIESCTRGSPRWTVTTPERDGHGVLHYRLTVARVRCGTQQVNDHLHATCWRGWHRTVACGGNQTYLCANRDSSSWHAVGSPRIRPCSAGGSQLRSIARCWRESPQCRMSILNGPCCFTVRAFGPIDCSEWFALPRVGPVGPTRSP